MARKLIVYCKNISEHPQEVRHHRLKTAAAVAVAPGGYVEVVNQRFMLPAGAICQIPWEVWSLMPALGKRPWSKLVERQDFLRAMAGTEHMLRLAAGVELPPEVEAASPDELPPEAEAASPDEPEPGPRRKRR